MIPVVIGQVLVQLLAFMWIYVASVWTISASDRRVYVDGDTIKFLPSLFNPELRLLPLTSV